MRWRDPEDGGARDEKGRAGDAAAGPGEGAGEARYDALGRLYAWFVEWSETAHAKIRRRDYPIRLACEAPGSALKRRRLPRAPPARGLTIGRTITMPNAGLGRELKELLVLALPLSSGWRVAPRLRRHRDGGPPRLRFARRRGDRQRRLLRACLVEWASSRALIRSSSRPSAPATESRAPRPLAERPPWYLLAPALRRPPRRRVSASSASASTPRSRAGPGSFCSAASSTRRPSCSSAACRGYLQAHQAPPAPSSCRPSSPTSSTLPSTRSSSTAIDRSRRSACRRSACPRWASSARGSRRPSPPSRPPPSSARHRRHPHRRAARCRSQRA